MPGWKQLMLKLAPAPATYRPERYYMRGPGPKYSEKHGPHGFDAAVSQGETDRAGEKLPA